MTRSSTGLALGAALLVAACSYEWGLLVNVTVADDVPTLQSLRISVQAKGLVYEQKYTLGNKGLPQSLSVVSKGVTGEVTVLVEGLVQDAVAARAPPQVVTLVEGKRVPLEVKLTRFCVGGGCCQPLTCQPGQCGARPDGCGGTLACGGCATGECLDGLCPCSAGTCGPGSCGRPTDGCGGTLDCGDCPSGQTCGGGAAGPNRCGVGTCTPLTVCPAPLNCGTLSDGCEATLDCGRCPAGRSCGGGDAGRPNVCECSPSPDACGAGGCGKVPDGCGGLADCPPCLGSQRCALEAGGTRGRCCAPMTCPAGVCGKLPDGCGGTLDCACANGVACQSPDGGAGTCCARLTACPPGADCGTLPDGCGGTLTCGPQACSGFNRTCGGGAPGRPNVCGCAPQCAGAVCGAPDGCGGQCQSGSCASGLTCTNGQCCAFGQASCNGACIDVLSNNLSCGTCGNVCAGGSTCQGGRCSCRNPTEAADGHCCPAGFTFERDHGAQQYYCYKGPFPAATHAQALARCKQETGGADGGVSALGAGRSTLGRLSLPSGQCGAVWQAGLLETGVTLAATGSTEAVGTCAAGCTQASCACSTCASCAASSTAALGCTQPYYCALEPSGAQQLSCNTGEDSLCPPGSICLAIFGPGSCLVFGFQAGCVLDSDCGPRPDGGAGICNSRNGPASLTGICQFF